MAEDGAQRGNTRDRIDLWAGMKAFKAPLHGKLGFSVNHGTKPVPAPLHLLRVQRANRESSIAPTPGEIRHPRQGAVHPILTSGPHWPNICQEKGVGEGSSISLCKENSKWLPAPRQQALRGDHLETLVTQVEACPHFCSSLSAGGTSHHPLPTPGHRPP